MAEQLGGEPINARESDVVKTVRAATGNRGPAVTVEGTTAMMVVSLTTMKLMTETPPKVTTAALGSSRPTTRNAR